MTSNRERSGVSRQDLMDYFGLQGARIALAPFSSTGIPDDSSEWKTRLAPTARGLYYFRDGGGRNCYEISSQLLRAADIFSADPSSRALDHIPAAVSPGRTPEVYRDIAAYILERRGLLLDDKYRQGQMTAHEISLRFPRFSQFMPIYFGQDGVAISDDMQFSTIEEGIALIIEEAHPLCMWRLPGLAAESYEALALFQNDEDAMDRFFSYVLRGGSGSADFVDFFPLLARSIIDHLAAEHPPVWPERD
ncbi:hypothetical protein OOK39_22810 [Streptomyces sp. NBC_00264]|uniref:hypothetical protein n=1 Tax=unclassified Streptomyces TaxID=2593676 RepID=UPI00225820AD|nr:MULTISPECIES: hypothetical protein [unclassified Streptomyces]MCX4394857.1 hypothetical protein [Streptomyces sp. NBC_01767]MCX5162075.1 hypothetical protein [Streptomyces sp. NBC_00305]MCX5220592.1 hypothetical protein [Streptomyces sp. NBC_00264]